MCDRIGSRPACLSSDRFRMVGDCSARCHLALRLKCDGCLFASRPTPCHNPRCVLFRGLRVIRVVRVPILCRRPMTQALQEPTQRVTLAFQLQLGLASASALLAIMVVLSVLLPVQVSQVAPGARGDQSGGGAAAGCGWRAARQPARRRAERPHNLALWPPAALDRGRRARHGRRAAHPRPHSHVGRAGARLVPRAVLRQRAAGRVCGHYPRPGSHLSSAGPRRRSSGSSRRW